MTAVGFSKRDYYRFGVKKLEEKFKVKILDFTKLFNPNYAKKSKEKNFFSKNYVNIKSLNHAKKLLNKIKPDYAFDQLTDGFKTEKLREHLSKNNIQIFIIQTGLTPIIKRKFLEKVHRIFFLIVEPSNLFKKISKIFKNKLQKFNELKNINIILISGKKGENSSIKNKELIYGHSLDFEKYLNFEKKKKIKTKTTTEYAVFLDQFLPHHPGAIMRGEHHKATENKYYPAINDFFDIFEQKTKLKVFIASHPRSNYSSNFNPFNKRKIIKGDTINLVKQSKLVFAHTSTSISFALLYKKPIIFLTSDEIRVSYDDFRIDSLSRELDCKLFNIDDKNYKDTFNSFNDLKNFNNRFYKKFIDNYIKHPNSPNFSIWDNLINKLSNVSNIKEQKS